MSLLTLTTTENVHTLSKLSPPPSIIAVSDRHILFFPSEDQAVYYQALILDPPKGSPAEHPQRTVQVGDATARSQLVVLICTGQATASVVAPREEKPPGDFRNFLSDLPARLQKFGIQVLLGGAYWYARCISSNPTDAFFGVPTR